MNQQFKNIKVHVPTPKISEMVQEKLFDMGYGWYNYGKVIREKERPYLYTTSEGDIRYGWLEHTFTENPEEQVHYLQILTENLDGTLFKHGNSDRVYYFVSDYAYWIDCDENKINSVRFSLGKHTTILDVNEKEIEVKQDNNEMPKLEAGKHAVKTKNGVALVVEWGGKIVFSYLQGNAWDYELDIVEYVYTLPHPMQVLSSGYYTESNLIWSREDESKKQARLEYNNLQEQISKLQEQANNLRKTLQL